MQLMKTFAFATALLSLALSAQAQDAGLAAGTPVTEDGDPIGQPYVAEEHGDWQKRCIRSENGEDPCQLYQLIRDRNGGSVAEVTVFSLPDGQQAAAGATIITPLETLLTEQVTLSSGRHGGQALPVLVLHPGRLHCTDRSCGRRPCGFPGRKCGANPDRACLRWHRTRKWCWSSRFRVSRPGGTRWLNSPSQGRASARTALSPPKAKAFESATSTCASRASFGTTSSAHSGSGSS